ncbi:MAG: alpha-mannosidase [Thermoproteus sp. AZ2]|uniref:Alpha-mannosidase n=1 Tax=Thermoproteus sp. AZ2 TaxID=1609232 RepID=A0ACC6V401_9CREN
MDLEPLRHRVFYVLAASHVGIRRLRWSAVSGDQASLELDAPENAYIFVKDRRGTAAVYLDGEPFYELDAAHVYFPALPGRHRYTLRLSPYADFGQRVGVSPGVPIMAVRDWAGYRLWIYAKTALELAEVVKDEELAGDLAEALDESLRGLFLGVTKDQIELALLIDGRYRDLLSYIPQSFDELSEGLGYREARPNFEEALKRLRGRLAELRAKYGKRGALAAVGHAHIDAAWLWPFEETRRKALRTFATVLTLMSKYDFKFIQSSALYYKWAEEGDLFARIKRAVDEGRWILAAGYVEPDTNLVSGESLARQMLYSQRYYLEKFGRYAEVLWLPDSFGFSGQLPQIARLSGIRLFATHKVAWNDTNRFPYNVFTWVGIDGSEVIAVAFGFGGGGYNADFSARSVYEQMMGWRDEEPMLYSFGFGDGGGGPTEEMLLRAEAVDEMPLLPRVVPFTADYKPRRRWRGEMYVEIHRGVYTSHSKMKRLHAEAERWLREAELWSALAGLRADLKPLWETLLKSQFHDVLPGSAIRDVYVEVYGELERVIDEAKRAAEAAASALAGAGDAHLAFNSLPWGRLEYVEVDGRLIPVRLPPLGYAVVKEADVGDEARASEAGGSIVLENKHLRLVIDKASGAFKSLFDKGAGREVLRGESNVFIAHENIPTWDAWDVEPGFEKGGVRAALIEAAVIERGPYRASAKLRFRLLSSEVEEEVRLYAGLRRIELVVKTNMRDRQRLLKLWFDFDVNTDKAVFEIPFGNAERPAVGNTSFDLARFESPFLRWLDVSEGGYGVAVMSSVKHGAFVREGKIGISMATTPVFPDPLAEAEPEEALVVLYPHIGDWRSADVPREAYSALYRPLVVKGKAGKASLGSLEGRGLILEALKRAEDGDGLVARIYEAHNSRGVGVFRLRGVEEAEAVDILERRLLKPVKASNGAVEFEYRPYEIITLKLKGKSFNP